MSRAHMLYDDRPLQQEAVGTSRWAGRWDPSELAKGHGLLIEGVFHKKTHHVIQDSSGQKYRFCVFHIEYQKGCKRRYDPDGKEVEANFGEAGIVNTGYLNSSYKSETKKSPDTVTFEQSRDLLKSGLSDLVAPSHAHSICMWGEEKVYGHVEVEFGQTVRLKTRGNSCLIDSLTKLDSAQKHHSANYSGGEKAGQSWTDKVFSVKQDPPAAAAATADRGGEVEEDEWDD